MTLYDLDFRNIPLEPFFDEMMSYIGYGNGDGLFLSLGSLDSEETTFPSRLLCAGRRCYQARFSKGERHFVPDGVLALKDRRVLSVETAEELLFHRLL